MQRELNVRRGEGADVTDGAGQGGVFSPQDSPCTAPRSPRSPRSPCASAPSPAAPLPMRSHSDSEAMLEDLGTVVRLKGPTESLFLDALSLDPLSGLEVPPPSRLESEKRFPCMKEVTHTMAQALIHLDCVAWTKFTPHSLRNVYKSSCGADKLPIR